MLLGHTFSVSQKRPVMNLLITVTILMEAPFIEQLESKLV